MRVFDGSVRGRRDHGWAKTFLPEGETDELMQGMACSTGGAARRRGGVVRRGRLPAILDSGGPEDEGAVVAPEAEGVRER